MQMSKYRIYKMLIGGGLGIAVGIAIATNTPLIALVAVVIAIAAAVILERRNKEIVKDERILQISGKAAYASFVSMLILAALGSLGIAIFQSQLPENVVYVGMTMGYFICIAVLLHICFYAYYSRKL